MKKPATPVLLGAAALVIGGVSFGGWFLKEKQARDAQYDAEIETLQRFSKANLEGASKLRSMPGGLGVSMSYLSEATSQDQKIACLKEQKDKNVSLYEGKGICESAIKPLF